ncbi:dTDP-4-dehydrorhamnose 3,5-epimerase family protein [Taibaiella koreensis]|uniref:dTDP-4-dehydrorhamnose 3,5-epimerase family protein n=1 Tax=Taibaiella koreensis TaxID=1268548 RepID=UPI000E59B1F1|nr:dTDP-4-dehydrorhamnose 3,5-epimerase family protein [Taibaiella koreensis]
MNQLDIRSSALFPEVKLITPPVFRDERGEFVETFCINKYDFKDRAGQKLVFKEDDISVSRKNVLRGLHGDKVTWKLIQCVYGEVFFALADLNPASPTYLKTETFILNDTNRLQVLVPPFFVNGYYCLSEQCVFAYKQTETYSGAGNQIAVRWNDPGLAISWPAIQPLMSQRDIAAPGV